MPPFLLLCFNSVRSLQLLFLPPSVPSAFHIWSLSNPTPCELKAILSVVGLPNLFIKLDCMLYVVQLLHFPPVLPSRAPLPASLMTRALFSPVCYTLINLLRPCPLSIFLGQVPPLTLIRIIAKPLTSPHPPTQPQHLPPTVNFTHFSSSKTFSGCSLLHGGTQPGSRGQALAVDSHHFSLLPFLHLETSSPTPSRFPRGAFALPFFLSASQSQKFKSLSLCPVQLSQGTPIRTPTQPGRVSLSWAPLRHFSTPIKAYLARPCLCFCHWQWCSQEGDQAPWGE